MNRIAVLAALLAMPALSGDNDPHRDWGKTLTLDMSLPDATACVAREMTRKGKVLVLPTDGGNDIDFYMGSYLGGGSSNPWERFLLRPSGNATILRALYRHPYLPKWVDRDIRLMQKRCLKVAETEAVARSD